MSCTNYQGENAEAAVHKYNLETQSCRWGKINQRECSQKIWKSNRTKDEAQEKPLSAWTLVRSMLVPCVLILYRLKMLLCTTGKTYGEANIAQRLCMLEPTRPARKLCQVCGHAFSEICLHAWVRDCFFGVYWRVRGQEVEGKSGRAHW